MNNIIKALKDFPKLNVSRIANKLGLTVFEVSQAQHEYLKKFRKRVYTD
ncbi:hypothetical protein [Parapedobacter indicus]|uniref:Winged helix-turn-helix DNA-binding n=1 Tax=Parapedobacter indicus TaxID=1477437 RepID=A0A1I3V1B2_9SPHI|nr:hypothetical protein [Parapedobacter indicus]PPK99031.1 hypothetical protein CLV26_11562 [Parapedobacter indicus]SFJ88146.1 hypothetical protein SAMN05444682_115116 [Parapedobacter indicus]